MYRVLSIDAWAGHEEGSWEWNNWHSIGEMKLDIDCDDCIIQSFIEANLLSPEALERVKIDNDGHNLVIIDKETSEPLYAVEYS